MKIHSPVEPKQQFAVVNNLSTETTLRRMEQRLDNLQLQMDTVLRTLSNQMDSIMHTMKDRDRDRTTIET